MEGTTVKWFRTMRFKEGDRVVYNGKKIVRGLVLEAKPNNVVIEWEEDRKTIHTPNQLNIDDLPLIQIDNAYYREEKLNELGI